MWHRLDLWRHLPIPLGWRSRIAKPRKQSVVSKFEGFDVQDWIRSSHTGEPNYVIVFTLFARNCDAHLDRGLGRLLARGNNALPSEFITDRLLRVEQEIAQEPNRLNQIGFSSSAAAHQHGDRVKFKLHFTDALEVAYFDPPDHKLDTRVA